MKLYYFIPVLLLSKVNFSFAGTIKQEKKAKFCILKNSCFDTLIAPENYIVPPHAMNGPSFRKDNYAATRRLLSEVGLDTGALIEKGYISSGSELNYLYPLGKDFDYGSLTPEDLHTLFKLNKDDFKDKTYAAFKTSLYLSNLNLNKVESQRLQGHDYLIQLRPEIYLKRFENVEPIKNPTTGLTYCYSKAPGTNFTAVISLDRGFRVSNSQYVKVGQVQSRNDSTTEESNQNASVSATVGAEVSAGIAGIGAKANVSGTVGLGEGKREATSVANEISKSLETGKSQTNVSTINLAEKYEIQILKDNVEYCLVKRTTHFKGVLVYKIRQINLEGVDPLIRDLSDQYRLAKRHKGFFVRDRVLNQKYFSDFDPIVLTGNEPTLFKGLYMDVLNKKVMDEYLAKFYPELEEAGKLKIQNYPSLEAESFLKNEKGSLIYRALEIQGLSPSISTAEKSAIDEGMITGLTD